MDNTKENVISQTDNELQLLLEGANLALPMENPAAASIQPNWKLPMLFLYVANSVWPMWSQSRFKAIYYPIGLVQARESAMDTGEYGAIIERFLESIRQCSIQPCRIVRLLFRLENWGSDHALSLDNLQHIPSAEEWWPLRCNFDLSQAISELGAEEAVSLFETTELHELARKISFVRYLNYRHTPLYSLTELANMLDSFIEHINDNSDELLRCGYPRTNFTDSFWLASKLGQLYFVEYPVIISPTSDDPCNLIYTFACEIPEKWETIPTGAVPIKTSWAVEGHRCNDRIYLNDGCILQESAPGNIPSAWLEEQADRLTWLRSRVLKAKLRILRMLVSALRRKDARGLWEECLSVLVESLTADHVEFLLDSEVFYTEYDIRTDKSSDHFEALNSGGLVDILSMIGHCEKEIALGTFSQTRNRLGELVRDDRLNAPRLKVKNYFEALRLGYGKCLDDAYDAFQSTNIEEKLFWKHHIDRICTATESEFKTDVTVRKQVKTKHVAKFKPKMKQFAQHLESSLELTGECPNMITSVAVSARSQTTAEFDRIFRQNGDMWTVKFDGVTQFVRDLDGMRYIRLLLESPGQEFRANELYYLVHPVECKQGNNKDTKLNMDELLQEYQTIKDIGAQISDPEDRKEFMLAVDERQIRQERLRDALDAGDARAADQLRQEIEILGCFLKSHYDHKGRPRAVSDPIKRIRQTVGKSISNALKKIKAAHPSLANHLRTIKTGICCSYDGGLEWQTDDTPHATRPQQDTLDKRCA